MKKLSIASYFVWFFLNASLFVYLLPLAIDNKLLRIFVVDFWFFLSSLSIVYFGSGYRRGLVLAKDIPVIFLAVCFFVALVSGYIYGGYGVESFREFRFATYFVLVYFVFRLVVSSGDHDFIRLLSIVTLVAMISGNLCYFLITKYFFGDLGGFYLSSSDYDEAVVDAFTLGVEQKFKYAPALFVFAQLYFFYLSCKGCLSWKWLYFSAIILFLLAITANMRSVIVAEVTALIIIFIYSVIRGRDVKLLASGVAAFIIFLFSLSFFEELMELLGNDRFNSQIYEKGIDSGELQNRINGLLVSIGVEDSGLQSFAGHGFGVASDYGAWSGGGLNPADSGFFHLLLAGGYFLLFVFLCFCVWVMLRIYILGVRSREALFPIIIFSSYLICVFNMFNDSPFLAISDVSIFAITCAFAVSRPTIN